jgi:hypothetical protein
VIRLAERVSVDRHTQIDDRQFGLIPRFSGVDVVVLSTQIDDPKSWQLNCSNRVHILSGSVLREAEILRERNYSNA